ncbi:MAG: hypothetical protein U0745_05040 [Polyangia bacterium]|mgnify:FL=1
MSDDRSLVIQKLKDDIFHVQDVVAAAIESGERPKQYAAGPLIPPLVRRYEELLSQSEAEEQSALERSIGRFLTDLRRQASGLAQQVSGRPVEKAADAGQPFLLSRPQAVSSYSSTLAKPKTKPKYAVGSEVEAWCGKCKELRAHDIVAVLDDMPKQVICTFCKSRHGFRTEPARSSTSDAPAPKSTPSSSGRSGTGKNDKATKERLQFEKELLDATTAPVFDPRDNFKPGQIIAHPKWGRGKIESVLRGSILVRFLDGLRQVSRQ